MYQYFLEAITDRKYGKAADLLFLISNALPALDLSDVKNQIMLAFRAWETRSRSEDLPYDEKSLVNAVQEMFVFLLQKRITLAASFLRVFRGELTLDASLKYLGPELDYVKLTRRYFRRMRARQFHRVTEPRALLDHVGRVAVDVIGASRSFGENSLHFSTRLRRSVQEFSATTSKAAAFWRSALNLATWGVAVVGLYLATVSLQIAGGVRIYDTLPPWARYLPAAESVWLWLGMAVAAMAMFRTVRRMARRLGEPEKVAPRDDRALL
jgi:ubiquinone biosynthesis protein